MKQYLAISIVLLLTTSTVFSQRVTGTLIDVNTQGPLANATVSILKTDTSTIVFETVSDTKGVFNFRNVSNGRYILSVTSIGYAPLKKEFTVDSRSYDFGRLNIEIDPEVLSTIIIDGTPPPVRMKGDTTEINASQFKVNPDATTEDLIKKMPGITVDKQGNVTAQGESVRKVTVDGREFFGDDASAALRNLPSEVVDKIQVFDRMSDQAQLTGFDDGNTIKSINIVTKSNMRQGNFGRIYAGYGTDDTYAGGGSVSFFNNARRISVVGLTNNINQQNFSSDEVSGLTSGGGGGGRRGGYRGDDGFSVGPQSGIAKTNALGINYNDMWGKKVEASGSYFFNNRNIGDSQQTNTQFLDPDAKSFYDESATSQSRSYNNNANLRIKYNIDSNNTILFTTGASFQNNKASNSILGLMTGDNHLDKISNTESSLNSTSDGYRINSSLMYNHSFLKRGRSISLRFNTSLNNQNGDSYNYALNDHFRSTVVSDTTDRYTDQGNNTNNYSFNLQYTEPIAPKMQIQLNYNPSFQKSYAEQLTYDYDDKLEKYSSFRDSLSNKLKSNYNTHNAGVSIRRGDRDNNVSVGLSYQYSELTSDRTYPSVTNVFHSYNNILGNVFARLKLGEFSQLRLMYRSSVSSPSVTQLQDVINTNNPLFYTTGNPNLQQQYANRLFVRFSYADRITGKNFFAGLFGTQTNNYITNATFKARSDSVLSQGIVLREGNQLSKPVNLDGSYNINSFFNFSIPLKFIKSNLNINAGGGYARQPGMIDYVENISNNYNYNGGIVLASNVSEYVDFNISYSINFNDVKNSINPLQNSNYHTQSAGVNLNLLSKKGTFFQTNLSNESYSGLSTGFNQSYWLWNAAVGQKFLKGQKGELKLSVFDLLKQNQSITRNVTATQIQDFTSQVLQQYFMLTFTYKLKNFGKPPAPSQESRRSFGGGFHPGGGMMH